MKTIELNPDRIITLNDFPVHNAKVLTDYFRRFKQGEKPALVPVIMKEHVKKYFEPDLLKKFRIFERKYRAEFFMLDGSHRTTALTLAGLKIQAIIYENDKDILEAKKLVRSGKIMPSGTLDHTFEENCEILNKHFKKKPYFFTVKQKTDVMISENKIPKDIVL